jgi:putative transposase
MNHFKGKQFKKTVIIVAIGYYLRYNLSYREVQELLYDRGINVCHTTIYRWVQEYSKVLYYLWKKKNRQSFYSWKIKKKLKNCFAFFRFRQIKISSCSLSDHLRLRIKSPFF